jgi:hypothetical protein
MTLRWSFITSSYFSRFLRMSKLRASTFCCAFSSALLIQGWTIASSSLRPSLVQHAVHAVGAEDAHQVVLQRQEELRAARVALAAGAAAQLVVDAPALVALGAEHEEAAGLQRLFLQARDFLADLLDPWRRAPAPSSMSPSSWRCACRVAAELDVGAAAGHVGGDGDRARHAGLGDDDEASCSW